MFIAVEGQNSFPKWLHHFAFLRVMYKSSSPCTSLQPLVLSTVSRCHFDRISKKGGGKSGSPEELRTELRLEMMRCN